MKPKKKKKTGNENEREQETGCVGRNGGSVREEEEGGERKKQRLTQITSISAAQTWGRVYHYKWRDTHIPPPASYPV